MTAPPPKKSTKKLTRTQITARARAKVLAEGGSRPTLLLLREPTEAIRRLVEAGYAQSVTAAVERAVIQAARALDAD